MKPKLISNKNFIVFGEDFSRHPHALEHILKPLFDENKFLWVETIGLRTPKFTYYDLKRSFEKIISMIFKQSTKGINKYHKNLIILRPFMIPYNQIKIIRAFNKWSVLRKVNSVIMKNHLEGIISITSVPNSCDYIGSFNETLKIYYCVDEFSLWPGLNKVFVQSLENKLIKNVEMIIATSDQLSKMKKLPNKVTPVISHGVDTNHFNIGPQTFPNSRLRLCYFGLFDERNDQDLIYNIMKKCKEADLHIYGNIVCDISKLKELENIKFHGNIDYHALPHAIKQIDIFILPYVRTELTNNINPLKLKEYLATGRPVIATGLPEIIKLKNLLFIANEPKDFLSHINKLISAEYNYPSKKVQNYINKNETWKIKTQQLSQIVETELLNKI